MTDREAGSDFHWEEGVNALEVVAAGPYVLVSTSHAGTTVSVRLDRPALVALSVALATRVADTAPEAIASDAIRRRLPSVTWSDPAARAAVEALRAAGYLRVAPSTLPASDYPHCEPCALGDHDGCPHRCGHCECSLPCATCCCEAPTPEAG